jgi:hypothetical protein
MSKDFENQATIGMEGAFRIVCQLGDNFLKKLSHLKTFLPDTDNPIKTSSVLESSPSPS